MSSYKRLVFGLLLIATTSAGYVVGFGAGWNSGLPTMHPVADGSYVVKSESGKLELHVEREAWMVNAFTLPSIRQDGCDVVASLVTFPGTHFHVAGNMHLMMQWNEDLFRDECPVGDLRFVTKRADGQVVLVPLKTEPSGWDVE